MIQKELGINIKMQLRNIVILVLAWCCIILLVDPRGNFAINDDWAYAHNVQALVENGKLSFSFWPAMTLIGQTIPAWIWSKVVGFNFTSLRLLTLSYGLIAILIYSVLSYKSLGQNNALLVGLIMMFNPYFLGTSFTFMSEVYYLTYLLIALFFVNRYYEYTRTQDLLLMLLFFALALLTRQIALIFAISFGIVVLLKEKLNWKTLLIGVVPLLLGIVLLSIYKWVRMQTGDGMGTFSSVTTLLKGITNYSFYHYYVRYGLVMLHIGFVLIPIVLIYSKTLFKAIVSGRYVSLISGAITVIALIMCKDYFPLGNVFDRIGVGPRLIKDVVLGFVEVGNKLQVLWEIIYVMTVISATMLVMFAAASIFQIRSRFREIGRFDLLLWILIGGEFSYLILNPIFFDRYVLIISLLIIILIVRNVELKRRVVNVVPVILGIPVLISLMGFMSWQRTRAEVSELAVNKYHVDRKDMDAGFEYNAWHRVGPIGEPSYDPEDKSWWFVEDDKYLISSHPFPGYYVVTFRTVPIQLMNPTKRVYLLKRNETKKATY